MMFPPSVWSTCRLGVSFFVFVAAWLMACVADAAPPNVVLILSDDQAWGDYGFMGHPVVQTPHLDRLSRESLTFRRGYVPSSLCCPSLASIITGQYPSGHRVVSNDPPLPQGMTQKQFVASGLFEEGRARMNAFMDAAPTLPKLLVQNGYLALQTGKWWQGNYTHGGFTHGMTEGSRHGDKGLEIGRKTMQPIKEFIDAAQNQGKPFLVWYAPMMPHDPHTPPERLLEKYRNKTPSIHVARYWAMVEWFDETCGELLQFLEDRKLAENTVVVYTADNGWIQDPEKPRYAARSKQSPYDGGLRSPMMVRWKGTITPRVEDTVPVSSLDFAPTILKACGVPVPAQMQGVDLCDESALRARNVVHGECYTHNLVDFERPASSLRWRWVVEGRHKLILPHAANEPGAGPELYDLFADPSEEHNLADSKPREVERLRKLADARWNP
jgi:arylsulfatase A-like enzyme